MGKCRKKPHTNVKDPLSALPSHNVDDRWISSTDKTPKQEIFLICHFLAFVIALAKYKSTCELMAKARNLPLEKSTV
jgi:hypothetical protein